MPDETTIRPGETTIGPSAQAHRALGVDSAGLNVVNRMSGFAYLAKKESPAYVRPSNRQRGKAKVPVACGGDMYIMRGRAVQNLQRSSPFTGHPEVETFLNSDDKTMHTAKTAVRTIPE